MASRRKAILSTGTLSSIREYEGEEEEGEEEEEDDGESIDMMGFLAEGEDMFGEDRISPMKQESREEEHKCTTTTPPFDRHRMLELHGRRLKERHDALAKCLSKSESESLEVQRKSSIETKNSHRWTPSSQDLESVHSQAISEPPIPRLRGGALFPSSNKPGPHPTELLPRPQIISRPSEAFSRVSDSNLAGSTGFLNPRVGHVRASVPDSALAYGGYSRVGSIVAEGSVASWYPGVDQRGTVGVYGREDQGGEVVELDGSEVRGGNEGRTDRAPLRAVSRTETRGSVSSGTEREKGGPIQELASPMESPRRSTWRNFSRPPTSSVLSEGSKLESCVSGSTGGHGTFFAPGRCEDVERKSSLDHSGAPRSPPQILPTSPAPSNKDPTTLPPSHPPLPRIPDPTRPHPGNHSIWDGGSHPSIIPDESPSEMAALRAQHEASLRRKDAFAIGDDPRARERSEERFRERLLGMWNTYQMRMKMIREDGGKTGEEKRAVSVAVCVYVHGLVFMGLYIYTHIKATEGIN